ncbi:MAG: NADH-quinone oxidoreductase subunit J [Acidobacteria bacterium]|nr:NADH-quinone oxidoreductase subunit J [Acidobacteriota bacterium]
MERWIFFILAAVTLAGAANVLAQRRAVHSALSLIVSLGALAGLYALLGAPFIAAIQVIVYSGAIMVLFLFVIMLLDPKSEAEEVDKNPGLIFVALPMVAFLALALFFLIRSAGTPEARPADGPSAIEAVGRALFTEYLLPFELTSVLILVAILGAIVMAKKKV